MNLEGDLKRYYEGIRKRLFCSRKAQNDFLAEAHRLVADFLENQPNATFEDVVENVGKPAELAEAFLNTIPDKTEIERYRRIRNRRKHLIVALLSLVIVVLVGLLIYIVWIRHITPISEETVTIIGPESDVSSLPAASLKIE